MKILFDCFSCSPYYGSDEGIGWNWPYYMRKYHEVWAVVRKDRKDDIEKYCYEHNIQDIHFIYADIPDFLNFYYKNLKKGKNGTLDFLVYQYFWQFFAYQKVRLIHKQVKFDLVHKVGTNDFRILGLLYRLRVPFIIGPVGGAQETKKALTYYIKNYSKTETLRTILNRLLTSTHIYKNALNNASKIFCSNIETERFLERKIKTGNKCEVMTEVGYAGTIPPVHPSCMSDSDFTLLWAGRMEYRKGLVLLFDALDLLPDNLSWRLVLCGSGSEYENYKRIVADKKYSNRVIFKGKLSFDDVQKEYETADLFVFPSLRETTGTVIIEAMAHAIPVIALKQGGAVNVISEDTGFLIEGKTKESVLANFSKTIEYCILHPEIVKDYGRNARARIVNKFTWEQKAFFMNGIYQDIIK